MQCLSRVTVARDHSGGIEGGRDSMAGHGGSRRLVPRLLTVGLAAGALAAGSLAVGPPVAQATGSNVGYACGYYSNVSLGGGPYGSQGCGAQTSIYATANSASVSVTLPTSGAAVSETDNDGAKAVYGPAVMFSSPWDVNGNAGNSGQLYVATSGTTSISSQARAKAVGPSPFWTGTPSSDPPSPTVGYVRASCSASSPTSKSGNVHIENGFVDTATDSAGNPVSTVAVPANPPQNYQVPFTINSVGDHGVIVFNERIQNPDGSLTVNGSHMYLQGPFALGEVIIAQVRCGHT